MLHKNFANNTKGNGMSNDLVMYILQGLLGAIMLGFGVIINGFRTSIEEVTRDLKGLNNAVLGQYMTRDDSDQRWQAQRNLDHELRGMIQDVMVRMARHEGVPYNYQGDPTNTSGNHNS